MSVAPVNHDYHWTHELKPSTEEEEITSIGQHADLKTRQYPHRSATLVLKLKRSVLGSEFDQKELTILG